MNTIDTETVQMHRDSLADIGEAVTFRGIKMDCIFSEVTHDRTPQLAGFGEGIDATLTIETALLGTTSAPQQGERIKRNRDGISYRIRQVIDNGGGLTDFELESERQQT